MPEPIPVLIVGAGPSGLTMAHELSRHGIDYRIVDKRPERTKTSNALAIHPRTLEMLDDMGVINSFLKLGQRIDAVSINDGEKNVVLMSTNQIESYYNFILSLPQYHTEEILDNNISRLEKHVERPKELIHLEKEDGIITARVLDAAGNSETISCQWLIACDGAHSTVRDILNTKYTGIDLPQQSIIADVHIESYYPDNQVTAFFSKDGPLAFFPIKTGSFRMVATLINSDRDPKQPVSLLEIQQITKKRSAGQIKIKDIIWISPFWVHSKMVGNMRDGSIFFAGDAAHTHSPAGGQGMNTGMQDAYNLAWKLALVIKGESKTHLLDTYQEERYPIAKQVLRDTEKLTRIVLLNDVVSRFFRFVFIKLALKIPKIQHNFLMKMSQLTMHYFKSSIVDYHHKANQKGPLPGEHTPDALYINNEGDEKRLLDIIRGKTHHLLIFTGKKPSDEALQNIQSLYKWTASHNTHIKTTVIAHPKVFNRFADHCELDTNSNLHITYNARQPCFYLIRPDKYVGCCSEDLNKNIIESYLKKIFQ